MSVLAVYLLMLYTLTFSDEDSDVENIIKKVYSESKSPIKR